MQKYIVYILLLVHVNSSIFISQMNEVDQFGSDEIQLDDINSLYEYVNELILGNEDLTPEDEDDDQARYLHIVKFHYYSLQFGSILKRPNLAMSKPIKLPNLKKEKISSTCIEIPSPPPKG